MKSCPSCGQVISEKISMCPACGSPLAGGISHVDDYKILAIIHEGHSSTVFKAVKEGTTTPVSIRLFSDQSGVDEQVADRLKRELAMLQSLPKGLFVQHYAIRQSQTGLWYRVSEWVDADNWGAVFVSGVLSDQRKAVMLFHNIASTLDTLHKLDHFMPYLTLDDILIPKKERTGLNIRINYKLSRFLNARATHHSPMLQKLLDCHPDILNHRAIDFKSAIWSLGKIFVEILSANPNVKNLSAQVDQLKGIDPELATLLKIMLSDDPDLRPQSMHTVVKTLDRILSRLPSSAPSEPETIEKPGLIKEVRWLRQVVILLLVSLAGIIAFTALSWFYARPDHSLKTERLSKVIESYTDSVAFLMVEYWLADDTQVVYKNKIEGTAFLVDKNGYLLTNRHVACPWLEDSDLFGVYARFALIEKPLGFHYRMYLWFEGEKAFKRLPELNTSEELSDRYAVSSAFRSAGPSNLRIAGVPRASTKTGELIKSPFKYDFAVLKIDDVPEHLTPLPLETGTAPDQISRLSPVFILGFPLGHRTQEDHVSVSITRGHVRRTSKEIIQVDSSIYKGNSGGPAINEAGKVIGIASGVVTDQSSGFFNVNTPLSDFGLVLPISRPNTLLGELRKGGLKWNGVLDFSIDSKIEQLTVLALENRFEEAAGLCDTMLRQKSTPPLIFAGGMLEFCARNFEKSRFHFENLSSIEPENTLAKLMLVMIDWMSGKHQSPPQARALFALDWRDDNEFMGFLARTLKAEKGLSRERIEFENRSEMSWRYFIDGLVLEKKGRLAPAKKQFEQSILNAGGNDWVYFLAFSRLIHIQNSYKAFVDDLDAFAREQEDFRQLAVTTRKTSQEKSSRIGEVVSEFESDQTDHEKKTLLIEELMEMAPLNRSIIGRAAFYHTGKNEWETALNMIDRFFETPVRETALSLKLGLLKCQIYHLTSEQETSLLLLDRYSNTITNSWYRIISKHIATDGNPSDLIRIAGHTPEKLITAHTALALQAEGDHDTDLAAHHYREAISTYLDSWNEYNLCVDRITRLRMDQE
ncbi:MAG: hypothetical protein D3926_03490 [Desulfobacteraceae bacterium]|nr:MAG: hypothetical protein D3926_03490 [Desulfobacteraceae bacterium]